MKRIRVLIVVTILLAAVPAVNRAQDDAEVTPETTPEVPELAAIRATFQASDLSPLVGEPVDVTLLVEMPPEAELTEWPNISGQWGDFEVRDVGELQEAPSPDSGTTYRQMITVILWAPGDYTTPETFVRYLIEGEQALFSAPFSPQYFSVPSVLQAGDDELRPLKPQAELFFIPPWQIGLVLGGLIAVGYGLRRWWLRRARRPQPVAVDPLTPEERFIRTVSSIRDESVPPANAYATVVDSLRTYLRDRYSVIAPGATGGELMTWVKVESGLDKSVTRDVVRLLETAELVKYAGARPGEASAARAARVALGIVREIAAHAESTAESEVEPI